MEDSEPPTDQPLSENFKNTVHSPPDSDYGLWLLVSRRCGNTRGYGGGTCANHVTQDDAADTYFDSARSRGASLRKYVEVNGSLLVGGHLLLTSFSLQPNSRLPPLPSHFLALPLLSTFPMH